MNTKIIERPEIPYIKDEPIDPGDEIFLNTGEKAIVIKSLGDDWRYEVEIIRYPIIDGRGKTILVSVPE